MYVQCGQTIRSTGDSLPEPRRGATGSGFCIEAPFAEETAGKQRACFPPDAVAAAPRCGERLMGYFGRPGPGPFLRLAASVVLPATPPARRRENGLFRARLCLRPASSRSPANRQLHALAEP